MKSSLNNFIFQLLKFLWSSNAFSKSHFAYFHEEKIMNVCHSFFLIFFLFNSHFFLNSFFLLFLFYPLFFQPFLFSQSIKLCLLFSFDFFLFFFLIYISHFNIMLYPAFNIRLILINTNSICILAENLLEFLMFKNFFS